MWTSGDTPCACVPVSWAWAPFATHPPRFLAVFAGAIPPIAPPPPPPPHSRVLRCRRVAGMTHMQFASGDPPPNVKAHDLAPEITPAAAHRAAAAVVAHFLGFHATARAADREGVQCARDPPRGPAPPPYHSLPLAQKAPKCSPMANDPPPPRPPPRRS